MYVPTHFEVTERAWALALIERHPFGLLVTGAGEYSRVSHIPMIAQTRGEEIWIVGHVARANPHAGEILAGAAATLVFEGPHAYVSASWYEEPYVSVPTWNYTAVHVCGRLRQIDAWGAVQLLSRKMEGEKPGAWLPELLDADYRKAQLRAIVAFELHAEALYAKAKLSQNRTAADRERVVRRLAASQSQSDRECAEAMLEVEQR